MKLIQLLASMIQGDNSPRILHHVPVKAGDDADEKRAAALQEASKKHGKPFKCAADGLARERFNFAPSATSPVEVVSVTPVIAFSGGERPPFYSESAPARRLVIAK